MYRIELQGVSMAIMKQILDYIFSGEVSVVVLCLYADRFTCGFHFCLLPSQITLSEETIQDMVQASDLLLMTDLKSLCCQFLESCIAAENCIGIRLFSLHYCLYHVHYAATEFLQTHFRDVALTEEFRELPPERLCELLSMEKLNVGNEKHVLEAVVRWFAHDPDDRRVGHVQRGDLRNVCGRVMFRLTCSAAKLISQHSTGVCFRGLTDVNWSSMLLVPLLVENILYVPLTSLMLFCLF